MNLITQDDFAMLCEFNDRNKINLPRNISFLLLYLIKHINNIKCLILKKNLINFMSNDVISYIACEIGDVFLLRYSHEERYSWYFNTFQYTWYKGITTHNAKNGHLECLKYAHENGCPWSYETTKYAAENGHLDCLIYALENKCPWHPDTRKYLKKKQLIYLKRNISAKWLNVLKSKLAK